MQEYSDLTKAVIEQMELGDEVRSPHNFEFRWMMQDIANHGADAGFHGFIHYHETSDFYDANENAIWDALYNDANDLGTTPMQMIAGFTIADHIADLLTFKNALVWYALERAANEVTNA